MSTIPKKKLLPRDVPSGETALGYLAPDIITKWITAHSDEYVPLANSVVSNGNLITVMMHPTGKAHTANIDAGLDYFMKNPPGAYWKRFHADRLCDILVYIVAEQKKNDTKHPLLRKIDGSH